jgi:hypothetical protein
LASEIALSSQLIADRPSRREHPTDPDALKSFGELNKHVLKPAITEVNALAPFGITIVPVKQGKKVVQINIGWWQKDADALRAAWNELHATRLGRKARIAGTVERISAPLPSLQRMLRADRLERRA